MLPRSAGKWPGNTGSLREIVAGIVEDELEAGPVCATVSVNVL